jgi:hypothetical protein
MIKQVKIGIDPGISAGCISVLDNGNLTNYKMPESFKDITNIFKKYYGASASIEQINLRPNFNPFANARMDSLKENYVNLKNAMEVFDIEYKEVAPVTWQKFHGLVLPKGVGEKGIDYDQFEKWKKELKHLKIHLSIETKTPNDEIIVDDIRYILETSGKPAARSALCDDFAHFTKYDLNTAIKQTEKDIDKFKAKEKQIRKKRYQTYITNLLKKEGYIEKIPQWQADSLLLLLYEIHN